MKKRILCLFLSLLFCLSLLPAAGAAEGRENGDVWSAIEALERDRLPARPTAADYEELIPQVEALVLSRDDCAPGSVSCRDGVLHWRNADGVAFSYDPQLRAAVRDAVPMPEEERAAAEREADRAAGDGETAALMSESGSSRDVAVFIPYWGQESMWRLDLYYTGLQLAGAMGGSCRLYLGAEATIDAIADALTSCRIVFINTHAAPGIFTLTTFEGLSPEELTRVRIGNIAYIDGRCITDHLRGRTATAEFVSINGCACMGSDGMVKALRDAGVELVFGWSRNSTFGPNERFSRYFADGLIKGMTAAEASVYTKQQMCRWILDNHLCYDENVISMLERTGMEHWNIWNGKGAVSPEEARDNGADFPVFVSSQDPYPGADHVNEIQNVKSVWKLPRDPVFSKNIHAWGKVGTSFAASFPDASSSDSVTRITLTGGELPPGIIIEDKFSLERWYVGINEIVDAVCLYGTPTKTGLYQSQLLVEMEDGTKETRTASILIVSEPFARTEQRVVAEAGKEQTIAFTDGHSGTVFQTERKSGQIPPGMTFLSDGGNLRFCGVPDQAGTFTAVYRIFMTSGKVIDHTVTVTVPARFKEASESFAVRIWTDGTVFLGFDGAEQISYGEQIGGQLPPGMTFGCSMSEAPNYSGIPQKQGTYKAVFRFCLQDGTMLTHKVTATVYGTAASIDEYSLDLTMGAATVPREDLDAWLYRSLVCAVNAGQCRLDLTGGGDARIDLDRDGSWDIFTSTKTNGTAVFLTTDTCSLAGDEYVLTLNQDALDRADLWGTEDPGAGYAKVIRFHLSNNYELYIAGTQVTSRNRGDILGNGVFSFDGVDTLVIHGDFEYSGTEPLIRNEISWLTVRTESESSLSCWGNCIETYHAMTLTGSGQLSLNSSEHSGIVCDGALLEIFGMDLAVQAKERGIFGTGTVAVHTRMNHANVMIRSGQGALDGFWSIGMTNCMVTSPMRGGKGVIDNRACLVDGDGALLNDVRITAYEEKYGLVIDGVQVTDRNREDVLDNGIFSFDGDRTLTINGSYEEAVGTVVDSVIPLTVFAAPDTVLRTPKTTCLSFSRNTVITGGPLTAVSDSRFGRGVYIGQGSSLFLYETELDARGGRFGIQGAQPAESESGGKLDVWASEVTASGPVAAVRVPGGLELEQSIIVSPEGGWFSDTDGQVCAAGGDAAPEVSISSFRTWELYVAGTQVTELNMEDVLGNGTFSFDGKHTLTVRGDCRSDRGIIESYVPGLVLLVEEDSVLETEEGADPIYAGADLTVTGPGKLSLVSPCTAAVIQRGGSVLTIRDADVAARGPYGLWGGSDDALVVENSTLTASGAEGAVLNFGKGVTLTGCEITSPAGAVIKDGAVVTSGGEVCGEVTIAPVIHVTGVSLSKTALTLAPGESAALKATVAPADAADKGVTWSSSKTSVAAVSGSGRVTAKAEGTAVITVKTNDGGRTAKCTVTVKDPTVYVTGVTLDKVSLTLKVGESGTLKATVAPNNATDKGVTWSSSETSVAAVSGSGKVTAKAAGTAVITVKTKDGGKTSSCAVTVEEAAQEEEGAISVIGGVMVYSIALPESGGAARIVAAWYDESGALLGCAVKDGVAQDGWKTGMINVEQGQKEYRLFALDSASGKPLIRALTTRG